MRFREYNSSTVHTGSLQWRDENGDELSSFTLEKSAAKGDVTPSSSSSSSSSHQHHRNGAYQEYHLVSSRRNGSSKEKLCWAIREYIPPVGLEKGGGNGVRVDGTNTTTRRLMGALQSKVMDICRKVDQICKDLFLPVGYPHTVAPGYLEYQFYDSLQGLSSYLRGVVSTTAVLSAAGVGDAAATAMSAAMTWAIRDGLGMVGGLLFSYVASSHFDAHVKEFRLVADVLNDVGLTLDMALP
eukprot:scaffold14402_cov207-Alexandrium_tamarense.AAC.9